MTDQPPFSVEPMSDLEHLELAKEIAAAKRGDGPMPSLDRLRRAVDSIRTKRVDFVASSQKTTRASKSSSPGKKATVSSMSFEDFGL